MSRRALGKGLAALIGEGAGDNEEIREIPVDAIEANPYQPRRTFEEHELRELSESIARHGVIQPLVVKRNGDTYRLVVGERRLRAAKLAGLRSVPALVRDVDDRGMMQLALVENLQRSDLNPIEEARAYVRLMQEFGMTQEQVAEVVDKGRPTIANALRLLDLPEEVQAVVERGDLSRGHAKALLGLKNAGEQRRVAQRALREGWSVRETEEAVRALRDSVPRGTQEKPRSPAAKDPNVSDVERRLEMALGTKVRVRCSEGGGRIEIEYYSGEELERILDVLLNVGE